MLKKVSIVLLLGCFLLPGCAATNAIHNSRHYFLESEALHNNSFKEIKQVKMHPNGDLAICMVGNQLKDTSEFTLTIKGDIDPPEEGASVESNELIYRLDKNMLHAGCDLALLPDDIALTLSVADAQPIKGLTRWPERGAAVWSAYGQGVTFDNMSYSHPQPVNQIRFEFGSTRIDKINTSWVLTLNIYYRVPDNNYSTSAKPAWDKGSDDFQKTHPWVSRHVKYYIEPSLPAGFDVYDPSYEVIGKIFDVLTSPIQASLCLITWGYACSLEPHPEIYLNIVPG